MKKYIPHAVIGIIAIIIGFTVTHWALKSSSKGAVPVRAELTISKPSGNMVIISEKKLIVEGKTSVGSGVMLDLKDSGGRAIFTPNAIKASKDGSFIAEVPVNDPGKYQLTVRTIDGKQSHTITVDFPSVAETPPYFVVNGWQRPNDGDTVELKDVNKIVVRDDDNNLSKVDGTSVQNGKEYKLPIPSLEPGEKRDIVANDTTGKEFKIILYYPSETPTPPYFVINGSQKPNNGTEINLKDVNKIVVQDDNNNLSKVDGRPVQGSEYELPIPSLKPGEKREIVAEDTTGKEFRIILYSPPEETPPYFIINGSQKPNNGDTVELKGVIKIVVRDDNNNLSKVDGMPVQGSEYELTIPPLKPGEKRAVTANDTTGKEFRIILYSPPEETPPYFVIKGINNDLQIPKNGDRINLKDIKEIMVRDDNNNLSRVDGRPVQGREYKLTALPSLEPGAEKKIMAADTTGKECIITVFSPAPTGPILEMDEEPPIFLVDGKEIRGPLFVRADRPISIFVKDENKLATIGSTSFGGKETTIPTSDMDIGTHNITVSDGINESSLKVIKYIPISLQIESPKSGLATSDGKIRVSGKVNDGLGRKKVTINDRELSADNGIIDMDVSLSEGPNKISIFAKDEHDTSNTTTLTVNKYTQIALEVEYPENGLVTNADSMHVKGKVSNGWGKKTVMVNGKSSSADSGTFDVVVPLQDEGSNEINVSAKDERDATKPESLKVIRDRTPPKFTSAGGDMIEDDIMRKKGANGQYISITIEDNTGVKEVKLNGSPLKIEGNIRSLTVQVPDENLDEKKENIITALDNAGNESSKPIIVIPGTNEEILKMVKESFNKNQYDEASKLLDVISKSKDPVPGMPLVNFYRGLISFKKGEKNRDFQKADADYETTVRFLKYSLPDIGDYPPGSLNAEYHRYYLGVAYYKRWLVLKQSPAPLGDKAKQSERNAQLASFLNDANDTLGLFINMVENYKTEAKIATMYNQAKNIVQEISKSRAGTD